MRLANIWEASGSLRFAWLFMKDIGFNKGVKTIDSDVNIYYSRDRQKEIGVGVGKLRIRTKEIIVN